MQSPLIILTAPAPGPIWRSNFRLRVGRLPNFEIVLDDDLVSRQHAEIVASSDGWVVRDLGSFNGTFLNGVRIGRTAQRIRKADQMQFGHTTLHVESIANQSAERPGTPDKGVALDSSAIGFWDQAVTESPAPGTPWGQRLKAFLKLSRDVCRISHSMAFDPGLQHVLNDVLRVFAAQRVGVLLIDPATGGLSIRSVASTSGSTSTKNTLSKTFAGRALTKGKSALFQEGRDDKLNPSQSALRGSMASVICAVLPAPEGVCGILHLDRGPADAPFTQEDLNLADAVAAALALGINRWQLVEKQQDMLVQTVTALAQAVEMRDQYTGNHTHRVTTYALLLADELGLPVAERRLLQVATPLHDIGKIAVDDSVLRKPGRLSTDEYDLMKGHVASGVNIIQMVPALSWALPVIRSHHEQWNGGGYPDGLAGTQIPLLARIVAVADAFDAMTTDRPYRPALSLADAFAELTAKAGVHFDPDCVTAFARARGKVEVIMGQEADQANQAKDVTETLTRRDLTNLLAQTIGPETRIPNFA